MKQIKDIELSSSSFQDTPFTEANNFFSSYTQSIFSKKLAEMKKNKTSSNRFPQSNQSNNAYDDFDENEVTPRKSSSNALTNGFFSPKSNTMLRDYTLSEKIRIKWLRSIRDYMKLQEMQVVYNYLKTANVKVLIREIRLRKCFTLWHLKYNECKNKQKWNDFYSFLVKKQRTEILKANASKIRKVRAQLVKVPVNAEAKNNEDLYGVKDKLDKFAKKNVENMLQPITSLKPAEKQNSSHHHHHRSSSNHLSEEINESVKTREINIIENEMDNDIYDTEKAISYLTKKNEELEKRLIDCERISNEQKQYINKIIHLFTILSIVLGVFVFLAGIIIGKSIISNKRTINTFINSQTAITQELTAEVADFRVALTKMSGTNKTVVPASLNVTENS